MVQRHAESRVAPKAFVFPGGTVRSDDRALPLELTFPARADTPLAPVEWSAYVVAAVRELFEEAGVLLARNGDGDLLAVDDADVPLQERLAAARMSLQARDMSLAQLLEECGWAAAPDLLVPFSHWVTPEMLAARYDTRFFVAEMPPRQNALHCTIETSEGIWLRPADLLDGSRHVVYATAQHLQRLAAFDSVASLLEFASQKPIRRVQPVVVRDAGNGFTVSLPAGLVDDW